MSLEATASRTLLILLAAGLAAAPAFGGEEEATVLRIRGERLAAQGHCEEAFPLLERALAASAKEGRAARVAGLCEFRLRHYARAVAQLEEAKRRTPGLADVDLYLAMARFHQGDLAGAEVALQAAAPDAADRAEYQLYRGLLLLQHNQGRQAAAALERARQADPLGVEPVASYYAARAWASANERDRAKKALQGVLRDAPESRWAGEARAALTELEQGGARAWWFRTTLGAEYDDNVILRGDEVRFAFLPEEVGGGQDVRAVWRVEGGRELLRTADWSAGVVTSYTGSAHQDLSDFNDQYPAASLWLDRRLSETTTARLEYALGYGWFSGNPFVFPQTVTSSLYRDWGATGLTRAFASFYRYNYLFGSSDDPRTLRNEKPVRNRDGQGTSVGFEHLYPLGFAESQVRAGYTFHRYSSRGREYSYQGHEFQFGVHTLLPLELTLDTSVSVTYKPYRHASSFFLDNPPLHMRRSDDVLRFDASVERPVTEFVTAGVRYRFLQNHSNVDVFDYHRSIVGAYLTVHFHD